MCAGLGLDFVRATTFARFQIESYMHHLLETTKEDQETLLTAAMFYLETAGSFEVVNPTEPHRNYGSYMRHQRAKDSTV